MSRLCIFLGLLAACTTPPSEQLDDGLATGSTSAYAGGRDTTADSHAGHLTIEDPPFGHMILSVDIKCTGTTAFIQAQTAEPTDELEVRRVPQVKVGEFGRTYQVRESYLLEPLLKAPNSNTYPWLATVALDGDTCADFRAQLEEVRGAFGDGYGKFDLRSDATP
jgi:hypothetical protein